MLIDKLSHVTAVFEKQVPYVSYNSLPDKSIRNKLLAFYLVENLPGNQTRSVLYSAPSESGIHKVAIIDELYRLTKKGVHELHLKEPASRKSRWEYRFKKKLKEKKEKKKKPKITDELEGESDEDFGFATLWQNKKRHRTGTIYRGSSYAKTLLVSGLAIYRAMMDEMLLSPILSGEPISTLEDVCLTEDQKTAEVTHLFSHPLFKDLDQDANPAHAAACYLLLFAQKDSQKDATAQAEFEEYETRITASKTSTELRQLLAFKTYHERNGTEKLREQNLELLRDSNISMEQALLQAIINWNQDIVLRLSRR
ncbi:hypothetical protein HN587_01990 [Candidatus Woesearchaeota archaeon]|mgnify:CR=1 FL=1|jgi:hypothetical protein|nr:hypothetical protein [Candidatus Woesearchaeota archaeon]